MRKKRILILIAAGAAAGALAALLWLRPSLWGEPPFLRLDPGPAQRDDRHFVRDPLSLQVLDRASRKPITSLNAPKSNGGSYFRLDGSREIDIPAGRRGRQGWYCLVNFRAGEKEEIAMTLSRLRGRESLVIDTVRGRRYTGPHVATLDLARGDRLRLSFRGQGAVELGRPVLYRLEEAPKRRYIFFVAADSLREDQVGKVVNGTALTPHISAFRRDSAVFANAYTQATWTFPSFISLFTAKYEFRHGVKKWEAIPLAEPFLIEPLARDYLTVNINGGTNLSNVFGFARGFDYFRFQRGALNRGRSGEAMFQQGLHWATAVRFPRAFLFLHTYQIHAPYHPLPEYLTAVTGRPVPRISGPESRTEGPVPRISGPESRTEGPVPRLEGKRKRPGKPDLRGFSPLEQYQAGVKAFDDFFGRFVASLKNAGLYEQSLIVFMADHGEEIYDRGEWRHGHSLYDEVLRVPLYVKFPNREFSGRTVPDRVGLIDVFPTLLDYLGIDQRGPAVDGLSLMPQLRGQPLKRPFLYASLLNPVSLEIAPKFAILFGRHKVIYNYFSSSPKGKPFLDDRLGRREDTMEIYDLQADPREQRNLAHSRPDLLKTAIPEVRRVKDLIRLYWSRKGSGQVALNEDLIRKLKTLGYL